MKKYSCLSVILIILCLIMLTFSIGFVLYKMELYPELNNMVDKISNKILFGNVNTEIRQLENNEFEKIQLLQGSLNYQNNYQILQLDSLPVDDLDLFSEKYTINEISFLMTNNNRQLTINGNLLIFDIQNKFSLQDSVNYQTWTYLCEYEIVTSPKCFQNVIVFGDIQNNIHILDIFTGQEVSTVKSPVMLSGKASAFKGSYIFSGVDNNYYILIFDDNVKNDIYIKNKISKNTIQDFALTEDVQLKVKDYVTNWLAINDVDLFSNYITYPNEIKSKQINLQNPLIIIYSPSEQGIYTLGLCDGYQNWIKAFALVSVFTSTGEMRMVSLDYVADNPKLQLHLSSDEIYYIVISKLDNEEKISDTYFTVKKD